ncbi:MAG: hypothetical protein ACKVT2_00325 [Saprospiraceae bacterium]
MQNYYPALFSIFFSFLLACNSARTISGEVNFIAAPEPGTILVSAGGYGPTKAQAISNAEANAFSALIFKGIPGSQQQLPMLPDETASRKQHTLYFDQFFKGGYKPFMMLSESQSSYAAGRKGRKNISQRVKINVDALRRDLEQNGITRKFGL